MFRSLLCKIGINLRRTTTIVNGESSSSSPAKYFLFRMQNQNVRVISTFSSLSTTCNVRSSDSSSFVVSYLINSCGLSENEAITASRKLNFKTSCKPDSVLKLLKAYGFTESHISKLIIKHPPILSSNPHKTLKPKLDFFISKGLYEIDLADFISNDPTILRRSLDKVTTRSFDILKSIVQSDQNVIKLIKRNSWILSADRVKRVMVNLELLRNQGVPQANISKLLIHKPRTHMENANRLKEILEKVKDMGFNHLQTAFLKGIYVLASLSKANWRKKMDVYKRWGMSEDQIQSAFRKHPNCMMISEKKIMAVMDFLVNEMGYDLLSISKTPVVFTYSLKDRIIPRCSIIRILVSRGLLRENIGLSALSSLVDESFCEKFVNKYEQQVPGLMKVFQGQLNHQELLQEVNELLRLIWG